MCYWSRERNSVIAKDKSWQNEISGMFNKTFYPLSLTMDWRRKVKLFLLFPTYVGSSLLDDI